MSYLSAVLADAPRHFWRLADPPGSLAYDIGSATLHMTSSAQFGQQGYTGPNSDGGSTFFQPNNGARCWHSEALTSPLTLEMLAFPMMDGSFQQQKPLSYDQTAGQPAWRLQFNGSNQWGLYNANANCVEATTRAIQHWYHVVGVYNETDMRLYVNGVLQHTTAHTTHYAFSSDTFLGYFVNDTTTTSRMLLAEAATYSAALSAARVTAHFLALDNLLTPISKLGGTYSTTTGGVAFESASVDAILAAVQKVFPTT